MLFGLTPIFYAIASSQAQASSSGGFNWVALAGVILAFLNLTYTTWVDRRRLSPPVEVFAEPLSSQRQDLSGPSPSAGSDHEVDKEGVAVEVYNAAPLPVRIIGAGIAPDSCIWRLSRTPKRFAGRRIPCTIESDGVAKMHLSSDQLPQEGSIIIWVQLHNGYLKRSRPLHIRLPR